MRSHSFETNVAVTILLLAVAIGLIVIGYSDAVTLPLGMLLGWLGTEIAKRYLRSK